MEWAQDTDGKPIFGLNGMAGTGKSTIARTVAESLAKQQRLGASFFFKRGEGERGNAMRFFGTVARDLMKRVPEMIPRVMKAIDADSSISEKALHNQFEHLIVRPLSEAVTCQSMSLVIVVDALDKCERHEDTILELLSRTRVLKPVSLRVFVTSRPELPIRQGFKSLSGTYDKLILQEVAKQTIERDIRLFFEHELRRIREQRLPDSD
jgi:hypothetical protein